jgi:chromate transporter
MSSKPRSEPAQLTTLSRDRAVATPPPLAHFLRVWLVLGFQSFGGGVATLTLIRRKIVEQQGWLSEAEFIRNWGLVQMAPGINLLGLTILIGQRVAGAKGVALALLGLLLPSVTLTLLLTALYEHIQHLEVVQAALRGVIPATVGLGLLTAMQMARPLLVASRREGKASFLLSSILLSGSGMLVAWQHWPVILVLCVVGGLSAFAGWRRHTASVDTETTL